MACRSFTVSLAMFADAPSQPSSKKESEMAQIGKKKKEESWGEH